MPFGLCNAPATFQRVMQAVLSGLEWRSCFVYLDNILIASRPLMSIFVISVKSSVDCVKLVYVSSQKKCLLLREEVPYLGHVISAHGIRPDPAKTEKVKSFPTPCDVTTVRQFH